MWYNIYVIKRKELLLMKHHYKQVKYIYNSRDDVVIIKDNDFKMIKDYILFLESELHEANGSTFSDIRTEMIKRLGEDKVNQYYGKEITK